MTSQVRQGSHPSRTTLGAEPERVGESPGAVLGDKRRAEQQLALNGVSPYWPHQLALREKLGCWWGRGQIGPHWLV